MRVRLHILRKMLWLFSLFAVLSSGSSSNPPNKTVTGIGDITGTIFLTSPDTGKIFYFTPDDLSMISSIQTEGIPWDIAFDHNSSSYYVSDFAKNQIYKLDRKSKLVSTAVKLQDMTSPADIELSSDGSLLYVLENLGSEFVVLETKDFKTIVKTKLPLNPINFSIVKDFNLIAIACPGSNAVAFLNLTDFAFLKQIKTKPNPEKILYNPENKMIYITKRGSNFLSVIDPNKLKEIREIKLEESPIAITLNTGGDKLYAASGKSNVIYVIDAKSETIIETIELPIETQFPGGIEITTDDRWLIVTSETTNTISIISLDKDHTVHKVDVGATTQGVYIL